MEKSEFMQAIKALQEWLHQFYPNAEIYIRDNRVTLADKVIGKIIEEFMI